MENKVAGTTSMSERCEMGVGGISAMSTISRRAAVYDNGLALRRASVNMPEKDSGRTCC